MTDHVAKLGLALRGLGFNMDDEDTELFLKVNEEIKLKGDNFTIKDLKKLREKHNEQYYPPDLSSDYKGGGNIGFTKKNN